jgi:hypothetical protein
VVQTLQQEASRRQVQLSNQRLEGGRIVNREWPRVGATEERDEAKTVPRGEGSFTPDENRRY